MQLLLKTIYYNQLTKLRKYTFFDQLNNYLNKHKLFIPSYNPSHCAIKRQAKIWKKDSQEFQKTFENFQSKEIFCTHNNLVVINLRAYTLWHPE